MHKINGLDSQNYLPLIELLTELNGIFFLKNDQNKENKIYFCFYIT